MRCVPRLILIAFVVLVIGAQLCAQTNTAVRRGVPVQLTAEEREWIAKQAPLRVGILKSWPPFSYTLRDGTLTGIDVDIANLISQRTGLKFQLIPQTSWETFVSNWD